VAKGHIIGLLVGIYTCVRVGGALDLGQELLAGGGLRFVQELLANRRGSGSGALEAWSFSKTFGALHNPCHVVGIGPQADFVHVYLVVVVGLV